MKKMLSILLLMLLVCGCACGEMLPELTLSPGEASVMPLVMVTPTPQAAPPREEFACEAFFLRLPAGMVLMDLKALEGYEAAAADVYPNGGSTVLLARDAAGEALLHIALLESPQTPLDAAREAAQAILGNADAAAECSYGSNTGAGFACTEAGSRYRFLFFSDGSSLLLATACAMEEAQLASSFATLEF